MSISLGRWRSDKKSAPEPNDEGQMTLVEHLRELRNRLLKAVAAMIIGMIVAWFFYDQLFNLISEPLADAVHKLAAQRNIDAHLNFGTVGAALMMKLKISLVAALIGTCPIWLYQVWAFIVPGLHRNERKWSFSFIGTAAPLFVAGVVVGYFAMPKGLNVLVGFTPENLDLGVRNLIDVSHYLNFILRLLLVFGAAFEIPVFVILLNLVGVLSVARLKKWRAPIIFGIFVFAAIATPSTDPVTMMILAVPMTLLFLGSEVIARMFERRKRARLAAQGIDVSLPEDDEDS